MEEFDDDDFSDLYADVEVQASSAMSAMQRLTEMRRREEKVSDNAARGEKEVRNGFNGAEIAGGNRKLFEHDAGIEDVEGENEEEDGGGSGSRNLSMENGGICGSRSESEDEDDLDNGGDDGYKQKFDDNYDSKYDTRVSNAEFGVRNTSKRGGGQEIEEDQKRCGRIDGKENSVNGGDYNSQRKSSRYDSLNYKKRRVDEMALHLDKSCNEEDAGMGNDRELCFGRAIEDDQLNLGRKYGGPNNAFESFRHTHGRDRKPLDSDKSGSVQISDSVEDNHREVSDCNSDGMAGAAETSDDTIRREARSMSNKISSAGEPESSHSGWSQHGRGSSCSSSPRVALSDKYIEKSHKHSKCPPSSLARELHGTITRECHPSKDPDSHGFKRNTRDTRYCERRSGIKRKHSNQHKKSNDMPYLRTRPTYADAYSIDVKRLCDRHVSHGKWRAMATFRSNENDMPYSSQSERFLTYSGGFLPDYRLGPAAWEDQYWNIRPSCRYKAGLPDGHNMSERQNFLGKRSSQMDSEASEDDWYHNRRIHPVQGNIERSKKLTPKYSSSAVNQRGTQFIYKGDDMHFTKRTKGNCLSPLLNYDNKFVEGKHRRICPSTGRDRDHLNHKCERNVAHGRREMENSGMGRRSRDSPPNSSDNLSYIKTEVNDRRNVKHRPFPFYSSEEPSAPGRGQFRGVSGPKSGVHGRNERFLWKEMHMESVRYSTNIATSDTQESLKYRHSEDHHVRRRHCQQSSNTYFTNECIKNDCDVDHFVRRRHYQHPEVLYSREEVCKGRQEEDTMLHSVELSYRFKRISGNNRADDRHGFGRVSAIDERRTNRQRSKMMREEDFSNQFDRSHKFVLPHSPSQMHPRYQDSVDRFVFGDRKSTTQSSTRTLEAGVDKYYGRRDLMGWNDNQKSKNSEDLDDFRPGKAVLTSEGNVETRLSDKNRQDKFLENQQNELLDIEEGQIITEEISDTVKCVLTSEDAMQINDIGHPETASNSNRVVESLDDQKIQEIMVKMERRRERFKKTITTSMGCGKTSNPLPHLDVETADAKLERPARKRRWSGT